jgi:hypothetical protein
MSCDLPAYAWPEVMPGAKLPHGFDFTPFIARWRELGQDYSTGAMVRVMGVRGFQYEATTGGQTGDKRVYWPTTVGGTVQDGSVTWTCRAVTTASLLTTLSDVTWTAPDGATVTSDAEYGQVGVAFIEVASTVATGTDLEFTLEATLADGSNLPVRAVLPVRVPERQCCA